MLPLIKMPVRESVSADHMEPIDQYHIDIWFEFNFAVEVVDDGFEGMGIEQGDVLLFRESSWPDQNEEIVLACYEGEEFYLRVLNKLGTYGSIILRGTGDVPSLKATQDSIIVKGICHHVHKMKTGEIVRINTQIGNPDW